MNKLLKFKLFALFMISAMASPMMAKNIIIIVNGTKHELDVRCTDDAKTRLNWTGGLTDESLNASNLQRLNALRGAVFGAKISIDDSILQRIANREVEPSVSDVVNNSETYIFDAASGTPLPADSSSSSSSDPAPGSSGAPLLPIEEVVVDSSKEEPKGKDSAESFFREKKEILNLGYPKLKFVPLATGVTSILAMVVFAGRGVYDFAKDLFSKEDLEKAAEDESIIDQTTPNNSLLSSRLMGFAGALACGLASLYFYKKLSATGKTVEDSDREVKVDLDVDDLFKDMGEEPGLNPSE